jgi:hypothetical protein
MDVRSLRDPPSARLRLAIEFSRAHFPNSFLGQRDTGLRSMGRSPVFCARARSRAKWRADPRSDKRLLLTAEPYLARLARPAYDVRSRTTFRWCGVPCGRRCRHGRFAGEGSP